MPRLNLRSVPQPSDPREEELRELAWGEKLHVRFSGVARRAGQPHIEVYGSQAGSPPIAAFRRSAEAIAYIEQGRHHAAAD